MTDRNCGACNTHVPIDHTQMMRRETDGTITPYHMGCEYEANKIKPCEDCGYHRRLCNDCAEPEWEADHG